MKIRITFERPYFEEETILALTSHDLDDFYVEANEVDRLNLFFVLETSLHRFQRENRRKAAGTLAPFSWRIICSVPLTPPASSELARFYIDQALAWEDTPEYRQWKKLIEEGN